MMIRPLAAKCLVLATGLLVAGCAQPGITPLAAEPDLVSTRIAQAAEKASTALQTISGIEQQRTPITPPAVAAAEAYASAPSNLTQPITVKWTGPLEQIVQTLAARAGMKFQTKGAKPPVPITVTVDAYEQPMIEMFRDLGLQAGQKADLAVDGQAGIVEIRYAAIDRI